MIGIVGETDKQAMSQMKRICAVLSIYTTMRGYPNEYTRLVILSFFLQEGLHRFSGLFLFLEFDNISLGLMNYISSLGIPGWKMATFSMSTFNYRPTMFIAQHLGEDTLPLTCIMRTREAWKESGPLVSLHGLRGLHLTPKWGHI